MVLALPCRSQREVLQWGWLWGKHKLSRRRGSFCWITVSAWIPSVRYAWCTSQCSWSKCVNENLNEKSTASLRLQAAAARSNTVILVKNLPAGVQASELEELFSPYGSLGRVLLPPSGLTAIVEFLESTEAKRAFTRMAYSKVCATFHLHIVCFDCWILKTSYWIKFIPNPVPSCPAVFGVGACRGVCGQTRTR